MYQCTDQILWWLCLRLCPHYPHQPYPQVRKNLALVLLSLGVRFFMRGWCPFYSSGDGLVLVPITEIVTIDQVDALVSTGGFLSSYEVSADDTGGFSATRTSLVLPIKGSLAACAAFKRTTRHNEDIIAASFFFYALIDVVTTGFVLCYIVNN